jgi:hypothetical protein
MCVRLFGGGAHQYAKLTTPPPPVALARRPERAEAPLLQKLLLLPASSSMKICLQRHSTLQNALSPLRQGSIDVQR